MLTAYPSYGKKIIGPGSFSFFLLKVETDVDERKYLNVALVVKQDNRRKHNSLEWFLASFAGMSVVGSTPLAFLISFYISIHFFSLLSSLGGG